MLWIDEWELAARRRNDATNAVDGFSSPWFTEGTSASGAAADTSSASAAMAVAWYSANSGDSTREVGGRTANSLGLYGTSGNVSEGCFTSEGCSGGVPRAGNLSARQTRQAEPLQLRARR